MRNTAEYGYNERLFSSGIRKKLHASRFYWLANCLTKLNFQYIRVLELGCFDRKTIDYLPLKPLRYLGFDASWEGFDYDVFIRNILRFMTFQAILLDFYQQ